MFMFGFPIILYIISLAIAFLVVKYESPKYLINKQDIKTAKLMLAKLYAPTENIDEIILYYQSNC